MATEDTIYTIMTDAPLENRIVIEGLNKKSYYGICFYRSVKAIRKMLDNEGISKLYAWGPPPYPWNCQVWGEIQDIITENDQLIFKIIEEKESKYYVIPSTRCAFSEKTIKEIKSGK